MNTKTISILILAMVLALNMFAVERTEKLDLSSFTAWASATYDIRTQTITPTKAWGGGAIWLGKKDVSNYRQIVIELSEACSQKVQMQVTYADSYTDASGTTQYYTSKVQIAAGQKKATIDLEHKSLRSVSVQLYSSTYTDVTIKLSSIYLYYNDVAAETATTIWTGSMEAGNWAGHTKLESSFFANCNAGDKLRVHVTELSTTDGKIWLQNGSWADFDPIVSYTFVATDNVPMDVEFTLTKDMLSTINSTGALIIKGQYYTMTEVTLISYAPDPEESYTVSVYQPIWYCNVSCPDNWGNSEYIPAEKFAMVTSGATLKVHVSDKTSTCQWPQIRLNTKGYAKMSESLQITDVDKEYSVAIPDDMISEIKANGVRISGCGYTFDKVTLVTNVEVAKNANHDLKLFADYDNRDICEFKSGNIPHLSFAFINPEAVGQTATLKIVLTKDDGTELNTYRQDITVAKGDSITAAVTTANIDLSNDVTEPGVYHFVATCNGQEICSYNIAYNLEGIDCPADEFSMSETSFEDFWKDALAELAAIEPDYTVQEYTMGASDSDTRIIYKVTMKSTPNVKGEEPVKVRGFLSVPKAAERNAKSKGAALTKYPVIIRYLGSDGGKNVVSPPSRTDTSDWCEFVFSTRGQMLNRTESATTDNPLGEGYEYRNTAGTGLDMYSYGLGDYHKHYYYGGYLDCRRAIDFIVAKGAEYGLDTDNIFATGGSQGGAFTYVAAALSEGKIKAIAPGITGHADFKHDCERVGWPNNVFTAWVADTAKNMKGWTMDDLFKFLRYYDVKNFSSMINCPCYTNLSLQDSTDPTHCNIVPYLLLNKVADANKQYTLNNFLGHATAESFNDDAKEFFSRYIDQTHTAIKTVKDSAPSSPQNTAYYNILGQRVSATTNGLIIVNGKKILK